MTQPPPQSSSAGRAIALLLVGLFMGAMVTLVAMQSLRQRTGYADGLMAVLQHHQEQLRRQVRSGPDCQMAAATQAVARLQQLAPEIDTALADHGSLVNEMTADLVRTLRSPPADCAALAPLVREVDTACKACHSQLR